MMTADEHVSSCGVAAGRRFSAGEGLAGQALAGLAWCETFVVLGMHCFWVLGKSAPLAVDSPWGALLGLLPFMFLFAAGGAAAGARARAALVRMEPALHCTASLAQAVLLFWVVLRNPMEPLLPLAAPMLLWSVGLSFVLVANLSTHLRSQASAQSWFAAAPVGLTVALGVFLWGMTLWTTSGVTWAVYLWTASAVLHAALAPASMGAENAGRTGKASFLPTLEALFLLCLLILIQVRSVHCSVFMGRAEEKLPLFLEVFYSPGFLVGAVLFAAAARFRLTVPAHAAIALFLVLALKQLSWPLAVTLGYILPALFWATRRQGALGHATSGIIASGGWFLGVGAFTFAGMVVHFGYGMDIVQMLCWWLPAAMAVLFAVWIAGIVFVRRGRHTPSGQDAAESHPAAGLWTCAALYGVLLCVTVLPGTVLLAATGWPPMHLKQPAARTVKEPMGLCHAGYSESEEEYGILRELGVQSLRIDFRWPEFQPGPDQWNVEYRDHFVEMAAKHGERVVAILNSDNGAVEQDPVGKQRGNYIAPSDVPRFLEFVRRLVTHYKGRVDAWEIWNEPDITRFWEGSQQEFHDLARRTAETVREADPSAQIVGTACTGPMGALMAAGINGLHDSGALAAVNHPSGHLYVTDPRHYYAEYAKLIGAARRHGHPGSVWITELGAPDGGFYPWCSDNDLLAEHVIKAYTIATSLGVDRLVWYCFRDGDAASQAKWPPDSEAFFGLLAPGDLRKPSAQAYSLFSKYCSNSTLRRDLVQSSGGLAARQLRSAFYRRDNGASALILWFEPTLRPWGTARARIDFGGLNSPPTVHDIGSGQTRLLLDDHIELTDRPVFLTFNAGTAVEKAIHIDVVGSPLDALWLLLVMTSALAAPVLCLLRRMVAAGAL